MKKNLMQLFHLTPNGSLSHFWREPIHIASVFSALRFSQETFSKQSRNTNKALVESKFDQTTVASSANCKGLDSKSFIFIRLISSWFLVPITRISTAVTERCGGQRVTLPDSTFCLKSSESKGHCS